MPLQRDTDATPCQVSSRTGVEVTFEAAPFTGLSKPELTAAARDLQQVLGSSVWGLGFRVQGAGATI